MLSKKYKENNRNRESIIMENNLFRFKIALDITMFLLPVNLTILNIAYKYI